MASTPRRMLPGEESPRGLTSEWLRPPSSNAGHGAHDAPGYKLNDDSVFSRLHADSAARLEKLTRMQAEAVREQDAYERQFIHREVGDAEEIEEASSRLYSEAENRRLRMVKKQQEAMYLDELQNNLRYCHRSRSAGDLREGGNSHWDKLYSNAREKEKRMQRARQEQEQRERQYVEAHSVHRPGEPTSTEAFDRLYAEGRQREWRREQQRILENEIESQRQAEDSVHRRAVSSHARLDQAARRLYQEGKARQQRLDERSRTNQARPRPSSAGRVSARIDALYGDASRRRQDRQWQKEQQDKKEQAMLKAESVHRGAMRKAKDWRKDEVDRLFTRIHKGGNAPSAGSQNATVGQPSGAAPRDGHPGELSAASAKAEIKQSVPLEGGGNLQAETPRRASKGSLSPRSRQPSQTKVTEPRSNAGARAVSARRSRPGTSASEEELEEVVSQVVASGSQDVTEGPENVRRTSEPQITAKRKSSNGQVSMTEIVQEGAKQSLASPGEAGEAAGGTPSARPSTSR